MHTNSRRIEDFDVIHNVAIGAAALWEFTREYHDVTLQTRGAAIPLLMPVLPLVFNRDTVQQLSKRTFVGGLYRGLNDDQTLPAGLQARMEQMAGRSLDALVVAYSSGLLRYQPETASVFPQRRSLPDELRHDGLRPLLATARRLGHWFGELTIEQVVGLLRIRF